MNITLQELAILLIFVLCLSSVMFAVAVSRAKWVKRLATRWMVLGSSPVGVSFSGPVPRSAPKSSQHTYNVYPVSLPG